ncbi:MAG: hypothetical protein JSS27_17520 [Planctomycetes bacterium]|nr:hypothetical protein [Planctomycetota bacterium]
MKLRTCSIVMVMTSWLLALAGAVVAAEPTFLELNRDPLLDRAIFRRLSSHTDHHIRFSENGASSSNVEAERDGLKQWFIEAQRYGGDAVEAGYLCGDPKLVALGWKIIDWGFDHQSSDGGFGTTGDPFHSTSFFVEASARAVLMAQQLPADDARQVTAHYGPKIAAAAAWMRRPEVLKRGLRNNQPYTHRRWLVAAAWGMAARVTKDKELATAAAESAREGLALQETSGVNPEKQGFDVSYQAVGLMLAARYYTVCDDAKLRASIRQMLDRGLSYELSKIDAVGRIVTEGSTRVNTETGRSGTAKTVDNKAVLMALVYGSELLGRADCRDAAARVAVQLKWIKAE